MFVFNSVAYVSLYMYVYVLVYMYITGGVIAYQTMAFFGTAHIAVAR